MTNPKAHGPKEKRSKALPAPVLAMGITDESSCISPRLLPAMRVSVREQLSLPRAAGSLLPSRGDPQSPTGDAPSISPSCCSSPLRSPWPSRVLLLQSSPRRWGKKSFAERAQPQVQGGQPKSLPLGSLGTAIAAGGQSSPETWAAPAARAPCLSVPGSAASAYVFPSHLGSPCLAYVKISPRFTCMRCTNAAPWQRAAGQAGEQPGRQGSSWVGRGAARQGSTSTCRVPTRL